MNSRKIFQVVLALLAVSPFLSSAFFVAPNFTLNLDLPPAQRWKGAVDLIINQNGWSNSFGAVFDRYHNRFAEMPALLVEFLNTVVNSSYPDHYAELTYLADQFRAAAPNGSSVKTLNVTFFIPWVFFYEFGDMNDGDHTFPPNPPTDHSTYHIGGKAFQVEDLFGAAREYSQKLRRLSHRLASPHPFRANHRACTGILALPVNRSADMIHGRNMDEAPKQGRNCTLDITVIKNGTVVYHIYDWTWMLTGFYTGSSIGGVTLELNWREHGYVTPSDIILRIMNPNYKPSVFLFRYILENQMDFLDAVRYLNTTVIAAPFYAIMSGTARRGAVLTLAFDQTENYIAYLTDETSPKWYMVQTNYDRWEPDPPADPRRTVAEQHLEMLGQDTGATALGVWMVTSVYPVHNTGTMYTVLLGVDHAPQGYIRVAMFPDTNP